MAAYRNLFDRYCELAAVHSRIAWIIDFRPFDPLASSPENRRAAADCFVEARDALQKNTVCEARVVDNSAARSALIGFDWLTGITWPTRNFAHRHSAERWCLEELAR